jgi:hypothetical protein
LIHLNNKLLLSETSYSKDGLMLNSAFQICTNNGGVSIIGKSLEFVHELQNLYFILTGKELNVVF